MSERASKWLPVPDIADGFESISFAYGTGPSKPLDVVLYGRRRLSLRFTRTVALRYEDECPGFDPLPHPFPMLRDAVTFPLLRIENSRWLDQWAMHKGLAHFALISSDDLVQLIASPDVEAQWLNVNPV